MATGHRSGRGAVGSGDPSNERNATARYTTQQFARLAGIPQRRLRSWTTAGVLPRPEGRGRATRYTETHVLLAKAIDQLRSGGVRLRDIPLRLAQLDRTGLLALVRSSTDARDDRSSGHVNPPPAPSYPFTQWQSVNLMPGLVLLVNPSGNPVVARVVDEIYRHYSGASVSPFGAPPDSRKS